ncbi:MAG: phosphate ABC transporter permease PstA [Puniceicoccaceae bacterium]|nr:phosphate ABC transporter permease PstA [Puniceicoccaceae bacterium]
MSAQKQQHIYSHRPSARRSVEAGVKWFFRLATYIVILAAGYIFANIAYNGSKAVFTPQAPFINIDFLTRKPQTLHVYEPRAIDTELKQINAKQIALRAERKNLGSGENEAAAALNAELETLEERYDALDRERKEGRLLYSDFEYRKLAETPSKTEYSYSNYAYSGGGIGPAIVGTCLLVIGSIAIALTLGVLCAVYLSEYSRPGRTLQLIRLSILNLSGVPSIVFGLFGFGMFVLFFGWGVSMVAGWFTLAIMALPVIITASEESMRAIPKGFREGSLALGASRWTSIRTNVLPYALPGILTSSIMGIARVAGETAPIMFTAAFALRDQLPWEGLSKWTDFFFQGVMALPYHIYVVSSKIPQNEYTRNMQYGAAFVFLFIVGFFALSSIVLRVKIRKKYKW